MRNFLLLALAIALSACDAADPTTPTMANATPSLVTPSLTGTWRGADADGYFVIDVPEIPAPDASGTSVAWGFGVMADDEWPPGSLGCDPYCPIRIRVEVSGQTGRASAQVSFQIESAVTQGHWITVTDPASFATGSISAVFEYASGRTRTITLTRL